MFVITGATGHTGSVAAETLLAAGKEVRVVVRDAAKAERLKALGAEVVVVDLGDAGALARAARGAEGIFLLSPPELAASDFISERRRLTQSQVDALAAVEVRHVVLLSSIGAQQTAGTGIIASVHNAEQQLRAARVPATFVRAAYFVENWGAVVQAVKQDGVLPSFIAADQRVPMVSTVDIGRTVAQALLDGPRGERVIELSGPSDVSPNDVATTLSGILGSQVVVAAAALDAVVPTFRAFGVSPNIAELYRGMYEGIARGVVRAAPGEHVRGTTPLAATLRALVS